MKKKLSIYEIICLLLVGGLIGFFLETTFYILKYGYYVNKQGLLYGPFKPIYGVGTILITFGYINLKKKDLSQVFIMGIVIGTVFEYLCSFFLEKIFHAYIWDYSQFKFNLNGRIYLPYCLGWGILAIIWIKLGYPLFTKYYQKFHGKKAKKTISIIGILLLIDFLLTGLVLIKERSNKPNNQFFQVVDKYYPSEKFQKKFPKIRRIKPGN